MYFLSVSSYIYTVGRVCLRKKCVVLRFHNSVNSLSNVGACGETYRPRQQATQSMKRNVFGLSCKHIISCLDLQQGRYGYSYPATKDLHDKGLLH